MIPIFSGLSRGALGSALGLGCLIAGAAPLEAGTGFQPWLEGVRREAEELGISRDTIAAALGNVAPIPRVIELDRHQLEFTLSLEDYLAHIVSDRRVEDGRTRLRANRELIQRIAAEFGVQPRFIIALWGIESNYGADTGEFPVIGALVTLAHDGRRSSYFRNELFNAMRILDAGHVTVEAMTGSWAGAMGQSQFMPSSFLEFAVDYDGDGRRDIWTSKADVFASIANYLANYGWRSDITWGRMVRLPPEFDLRHASLDRFKTLGAWQALGVRREDGRDLPIRQLAAALVVPDSEGGGPAYLVYDNFQALMKWNPSTFFATAVGHLSDRIGAP
ncbi:MAG: lytic transglycosylase domain-containing protein [Kiloniellales bacterium]